MQYDHTAIEGKWQQAWRERNTYRVDQDFTRPKFYVLDMFPYPSGAGLHVGHPLGYIASDIVARYKRHKGFHVLHPMGYDAFGLPAEQYAIQTGQHPAKTTEENTARYRQQLDAIGFSFDWERQVFTSDPSYYKWTQWIFLQLFDSWYDAKADKARPISELVACFEKDGSTGQDTSVLTGDIEEFQLKVLHRLQITGQAGFWLGYEDLRDAAQVVKGRKVAAGTSAWVVPGSGLVKEQAVEEGLDRIFIEAGFDWREPGCSMCLAMNGERLEPGQRCASTSNRNFEGRQGRGVRTHLMSPAMAAAAAVTGRLTDVRELI